MAILTVVLVSSYQSCLIVEISGTALRTNQHFLFHNGIIGLQIEDVLDDMETMHPCHLDFPAARGHYSEAWYKLLRGRRVAEISWKGEGYLHVAPARLNSYHPISERLCPNGNTAEIGKER